MIIWLFANESNLESATVDGYRLQIGDDTGGDEIRLQSVTNGSATTILTSSSAFSNGITDFGFMIRVTRSSAGSWELFTDVDLSTITSGSGAVATSIPNAANVSVSQGTATNTTYTPTDNSYIGLVAIHTSGTNGRAAVEFDQIYFTPTSSTPTVGFATATSMVSEGAGTHTVDVTFTNYAGSPVTVAIAATSGTAEAGDYTLTTTSLTFSANGTQQVNITINNDADFDDETFELDLSISSGTATLGTSNHTVTIEDDDSAPTIGFDAPSSTVLESDGSHTVPVTLTGYAGSPVTLDVTASNVTAEPADYTLNTTSLTFTGNGTQNISLTINTDTDCSDETFNLDLTIAAGTADLDAPNHIVTIDDNTASNTYYSQGSGVWNSIAWNSEADGSGCSLSFPDNPAADVTIQTGHSVTLPGSADFSVNNLTIQTGATLSAGSASNRYVQVYGPTVTVNGTLGGDGMSLDINGPTCAIGGTGTINLSRLRKDCSDGSIAATTNLTINRDITLTWSTTASLYNANHFNNTAQRTFNVTIPSGITVTAAGDVAIDGTNGINGQWQDGTFTIDGTLDIAGNLYVRTTSNPAGGTLLYDISGRVVVDGQVIGNETASGAASANLTLRSGGILELAGAGVVMTEIGGAYQTIDLQTGSTVIYDNTSAQTVEDEVTYANMSVRGGSSKTLEGNTTVNGTLTFTSGKVVLGAFNLTMGSGASITGASSSNHVQTSGAGFLIRPVGPASGTVAFPVGRSTYNPLTLTNSGTLDNFSVRVFDDVYTLGNEGAGSVLTTQVVDRTWICNEAVAGGSNATMTLQWNAAEELTGFTRTASYISRFVTTGWNADVPGAATGANPYTRTRSNITAFSPFALGSNAQLPVEWTYFDARLEGKEVRLDWGTATETDNDFFLVERSADGREYQPIGRVEGAGTTAQPQHYTFYDQKPLPGANYYRLQQTDYDGSTDYSPVRVVVAPGSAGEWSCFPNPVQDILYLNGDFTQVEQAWLYNSLGQLVSSFDLIPGQGLDLSGLPEGTYYLRIQDTLLPVVRVR